MQLKAIEYFIAIVDAGSFTAAAENLFISQPALSQHIRKLEDEIGVKLFDRSKHSAELTEAGNLFLHEGKRILQIYNQLLHRLSLLEHPAEEVVRFGMSAFYANHFLPDMLSALVKECPTVKYELVEDYSHIVEKAVIKGTLDFCLTPRIPESPLLTYETVYQDSFLLAVPKDSPVNKYAIPADGLPFMELKNTQNEPFISLNSAQKNSELYLQYFKQAGFVPNIICEMKKMDTLHKLISMGLGVGFVSELQINQIEKENRPMYYRILPSNRYEYAIAYRQGEILSPTVKQVIDIFQRAFHRMGGQ